MKEKLVPRKRVEIFVDGKAVLSEMIDEMEISSFVTSCCSRIENWDSYFWIIHLDRKHVTFVHEKSKDESD